MGKKNGKIQSEHTGSIKPVRRKYQKPEVKTYGPMAKLTLGNGSVPTFDGMSGMNSRK